MDSRSCHKTTWPTFSRGNYLLVKVIIFAITPPVNSVWQKAYQLVIPLENYKFQICELCCNTLVLKGNAVLTSVLCVTASPVWEPFWHEIQLWWNLVQPDPPHQLPHHTATVTKHTHTLPQRVLHGLKLCSTEAQKPVWGVVTWEQWPKQCLIIPD